MSSSDIPFTSGQWAFLRRWRHSLLLLIEELRRLEPLSDLLLGGLLAVRCVCDVLTDLKEGREITTCYWMTVLSTYHQGEISANRSRRAVERVRLSEHQSSLVHHINALEDYGHGGSRSHVPERERK